MALPFPPQLTGDNTRDILALHRYLYEVLIDVQADDGWLISGVVEDRTLTVGDSLAATQQVLGTLIAVLVERGILSA